MAYVEFHQPPKGKKQSNRGSGHERQQQVEEEDGSLPASFRPRPKSKESFGQFLPLPPPPSPPTQSVTFKFKEMLENERPALAAMFPMTRMPGATEYIIISDSESEPDDRELVPEEEKKKKPGKGKVKESQEEKRNDAALTQHHHLPQHLSDGPPKTKGATDDENEELVKLDRTFKEKLNHLTKDIGNLLSQPKSNLREFLRRREGYEPADKSSNHKRVNHMSDDDEEQLIIAKTPPS